MLGVGLNATKGDAKNIQGFEQALRTAKIDSPRGAFTISKSHNPIQDIYLRKVVGKENMLESVASKALADPGLGCKM
jgi:branched-chain amino acid transport system substrate-binding protein